MQWLEYIREIKGHLRLWLSHKKNTNWILLFEQNNPKVRGTRKNYGQILVDFWGDNFEHNV
jgi:hypothetical protein